MDEACAESNEFSQMRTLVFRKKEGKNKRQHSIVVITRYRIIRLKQGSSRVFSFISNLRRSKNEYLNYLVIINKNNNNNNNKYNNII